MTESAHPLHPTTLVEAYRLGSSGVEGQLFGPGGVVGEGPGLLGLRKEGTGDPDFRSEAKSPESELGFEG